MSRPAESYRSFRRAHARKLRLDARWSGPRGALIWRRLKRRTDSAGQITVVVPAEV